MAGFDHEPRTGSGLSRETVWTFYYVICGAWLLSAIWDVINTLVILPRQPGYEGIGGFAVVGLVFAGVQALIAIGLFARVEIARGIVNVIACINILFSLFGLLGGMMVTLVLGPLGVVITVMNIVEILVNGCIIWIIGETDRQSMQ